MKSDADPCMLVEANPTIDLQMDEIRLLRNLRIHLPIISTKELKIIRINIVAANLIGIIIAGQVTRLLSILLLLRILAKRTRLQLMRQLASLRIAHTGIAELRALMNMAFGTRCAFFAISVDGKWTTNLRARRDTNVAVATVLLGTVAFGEMQTCWRAFWSQLMGKITLSSGSAIASQEKILANREFVLVMDVSAAVDFGANS